MKQNLMQQIRSAELVIEILQWRLLNGVAQDDEKTERFLDQKVDRLAALYSLATLRVSA
tara:strand:- start:5 stop:181 length:177 start_codon:yes stop_codon:yes gene_type:complete